MQTLSDRSGPPVFYCPDDGRFSYKDLVRVNQIQAMQQQAINQHQQKLQERMFFNMHSQSPLHPQTGHSPQVQQSGLAPPSHRSALPTSPSFAFNRESARQGISQNSAHSFFQASQNHHISSNIPQNVYNQNNLAANDDTSLIYDTLVSSPMHTTENTSAIGQSFPMKAHVFWDYENCQIPRGVAGYHVVRQIKSFVKNKNAVLANIFAIGNVERLPASTRIELEGAGVILQNVTCEKPSAADITILTEMTKVIFENRPPHVIVLISGDRDFSKLMSWLENVQYHVILIHPPNVSQVLVHSVPEAYLWSQVVPALPESPAKMQKSGSSKENAGWDMFSSPSLIDTLTINPGSTTSGLFDRNNLAPSSPRVGTNVNLNSPKVITNLADTGSNASQATLSSSSASAPTASVPEHNYSQARGSYSNAVGIRKGSAAMINTQASPLTLSAGAKFALEENGSDEKKDSKKSGYCQERFLPMLREIRKMSHNEALTVLQDADPTKRYVRAAALINVIKVTTGKKKKTFLRIASNMNLIDYEESIDGVRQTEAGLALVSTYKGRVISEILARVPVLEYVDEKFRPLINLLLDAKEKNIDRVSIKKVAHQLQTLLKSLQISCQQYIEQANQANYIRVEGYGLTLTVAVSDTMLQLFPAMDPSFGSLNENVKLFDEAKWLPLTQHLRASGHTGAWLSGLGSTVGAKHRAWMLRFGPRFKDCVEEAEKQGVVVIDRNEVDWKIFLNTARKVVTIPKSTTECDKQDENDVEIDESDYVTIAGELPEAPAFVPSGGRFEGLDEEGRALSSSESASEGGESSVCVLSPRWKAELSTLTEVDSEDALETSHLANSVNTDDIDSIAPKKSDDAITLDDDSVKDLEIKVSQSLKSFQSNGFSDSANRNSVLPFSPTLERNRRLIAPENFDPRLKKNISLHSLGSASTLSLGSISSSILTKRGSQDTFASNEDAIFANEMKGLSFDSSGDWMEKVEKLGSGRNSRASSADWSKQSFTFKWTHNYIERIPAGSIGCDTTQVIRGTTTANAEVLVYGSWDNEKEAIVLMFSTARKSLGMNGYTSVREEYASNVIPVESGEYLYYYMVNGKRMVNSSVRSRIVDGKSYNVLVR